MKKRRGIRKGHIAFLLVALAIASLTVMFIPQPEAEVIIPPKYEPAHPNAPRLASLGILDGVLEYSPEIRYYEVDVPDGNPVLPEVWATAPSDEVNIEIYQAYFTEGKETASARVTLSDGEYTNSYEIRFVKNRKLGVVLQYDDSYPYVPDYKLKKGESFVFMCDSSAGNVEIDSNGVIYAKDISDKPSLISVYVGNKNVESLTVNKTVKAEIDMFIVAGQGNAAGEGGNADQSIKPAKGTAYTIDINDRTFAMNDMSGGRVGFTPALADKWYDLTGQKSLFLQCAISDVSVTEWVEGGEAFDLALTRFNYHMNKLNSVNSKYTVKKIFCVWFHGEWDVAHGMSAEVYAQYFDSFYNSFKEKTGFEVMAVVPAKAAVTNDDEFGIVTDVCAAQYYVSNSYDDIRVMTEKPFYSSVSNGAVGADRLYYTQAAFNEIGTDIAGDLYNIYGSDTGKWVNKLVVFGDKYSETYEDGQTVKIKKGESVRAVVSVLPVYAANNTVNVTYDKELISYTAGGRICLTGDLTDKTEIIFECGGITFSLWVELEEEREYISDGALEYTWEFSDLKENSGTNDLALSSRSDANKLIFENGALVSYERRVDLSMAVPVLLTSDTDWSLEWRGLINDNSIILGNEFSTKGYIYLAPYAQNMGYSVRMVDDDGQTFYLNYGDSANQNTVINDWKIDYARETGVMSLYLNGNKVHENKIGKPFSFTFTNILGRYGSDTLNYCYIGRLDNMKITVNKYRLIESAPETQSSGG